MLNESPLKADTQEPSADISKRLYIDLPKEQLDVIKGLKVGETITFSVSGEIVSVESSKYQSEEGNDARASFCVEDFTVKVLGRNVFTDLAEDED